ncbi:MAG: hypothetical protein N5P05_003198 [Chroococcopsis gigantea SAG 12.99]|jgi:CHAT domain-containing protein|nr:hypothetical protein [Chroococcopsis gigantea SAG 12.99]
MPKLRLLKYIGLLVVGLLLSMSLSFNTAAYSLEPEQLVARGVKRYESGDYQEAIADWQTALKVYKSTGNSGNIAIISENIARTYQGLGDASTAIAYWQSAIDHFAKIGNGQKVGRNLTEQAQSYAALGQSRNSIKLLCGNYDSSTPCVPNSSLEIARREKDQIGEIAALGSLGEAYRAIGLYSQSIMLLEEAARMPDSPYRAPILNSLANTHTKQGDRLMIRANSARARGSSQGDDLEKQAHQSYQKAREFLTESNEIAQGQNNLTGQLQAELNLIQLGSQIAQNERMSAIEKSLWLLEKIPNSPDKIYGAITLANLPADGIPLTEPLAQCPKSRKLSATESENLLKSSLENARELENYRLQSFAAGALGHYHECGEDYSKALEYTRQAILNADQNGGNLDSLYLWQWQTGRIRIAQKQIEPAIAAYQNAVTSLEHIRRDILSSERDLQFDFRDQIEPVYRELAKLRLKKATGESLSSREKERELTRSLDTIDGLRLAELENYLGNDCFLDDKISQQTEISRTNTAIFNSIILDRETAIIVRLPDGEEKIHWLAQPRSEINRIISQFRQELIESRLAINDYDLSQHKNLYDWLISPFQEDLESQKVKTLVFIQDGLFQTIPMSALYDGEKFIIEKYAIAMTPSLSLVSSEPNHTAKESALILGVTKPTVIDQQNFQQLANVPLEVSQVQLEFKNHKLLLDEAFNRENLEKSLEQSNYKVIHVATHAQFGTIPDDTFLVVGNNKKLTIKELEKVLRQLGQDSKLIELLALTACQTAEGDERSSLGLAGIAVQAGVKSVLASLWSIPDESTSVLITEFYRNLNQKGIGKAEALRQAQLSLIRAKQEEGINDQYDNPAYWAPFILLGNWN